MAEAAAPGLSDGVALAPPRADDDDGGLDAPEPEVQEWDGEALDAAQARLDAAEDELGR